MNKGIGMLFTFIAGVGVGVVATYKVAETKYKNIADAEIDSVIQSFSNRKPLVVEKIVVEETVTKVAEDRPVQQKKTISEYKEAIDRFGYDKIAKQNSNPNKKERIEEDMKVSEKENISIYTISSDEFDTLDDFTSETLYYSSDNYVLDSGYQIMPDIEVTNKLGHDPYASFGEYDDSYVYVRNEDLMCDYEIILSAKTAKEIMED